MTHTVFFAATVADEYEAQALVRRFTRAAASASGEDSCVISELSVTVVDDDELEAQAEEEEEERRALLSAQQELVQTAMSHVRSMIATSTGTTQPDVVFTNDGARLS